MITREIRSVERDICPIAKSTIKLQLVVMQQEGYFVYFSVRMHETAVFL